MCRPASEGGRRCAAHQGQQRRDADRARYYRKTTGERVQIINGMIPAAREAGIGTAQMHEVIFEKPSPKGLTEKQLTDAIAAVEFTAPEVTKIRHRLADLLVELCWRTKHKARTIAWMLEGGFSPKVRVAVIETQNLPASKVVDLLGDGHPKIRYTAASKLTDQTQIKHLAEKGELHVQRGLVHNPHTPDAVLKEMASRTFELDGDGNEVNTGGFDLVRNGAANELVRRGVRKAGKQNALPQRDLAGNLR